ncbi:MAG: response regulator transcription factor [Clostridium sp.]|nr:response regulator transcription factor [Clostridium sp.]
MAEKYKQTDRMSDIISDDYRLLQVISRFGLTLGFGDQTVASACEASGVDTDTFLAVVSFIKSNGRVNVGEMVENISVKAMVKYLQSSHTYFVDFRLPSIRRKLIESIDCSARNQIAFLILKFYDEFAAEVGRHMEYENKYIHSYVNGLLTGKKPDETENIYTLVHQHHDNHASIEKSLSELKSIIIKYYPSDSNSSLLNDVLMDLYIMEEDLFSHCHMEDTLFAEAVHQLEEECLRKAETEPSAEEDGMPQDNNGTGGLSEREREVIVCVVKGMSNKEIAEQLFISVNTVMTHRRNISRKLQIHSPAGLTIYAIVNGLITLDEIKI